MSGYAEFLASKTKYAPAMGCEPGAVHPMLHDWQARIVQWAVSRGRAAVWADTGLGKTVMQLEWARLMGGRAIVVAPLAVCEQTVREAHKLDVDAHYLRADDGRPGIVVTNYEMLHHFDPSAFTAIVLDESSCLKQSDGKTRTALIKWASGVPHRLACSATPAPNDMEELTNQAEWLGVARRVEMLAAYFVHDDEGWRLKGHARHAMFRWMTSWAVALRRPSDIGGSDDGYVLPGLEIVSHLLPVDVQVEGQLFTTDLGGVGGRAQVRRATLDARVERVAKLVCNEPDESWLLWCGLNDEARKLAALLPGSVNVEGDWKPEAKAEALLAFADGRQRVLITKPSIASLGLNLQRCARMAFVGLSDSYEQYYQAIRRCYRFGQSRVVHAHVVLSELERAIADNVASKQHGHNEMTAELVNQMRLAGELTA